MKGRLGPLEGKIISTRRDLEKFPRRSHLGWAWGLKEERTLSVQKVGKGIPGMPGRGNFVSKSLEAVKWWWAWERAGFVGVPQVQGLRGEKLEGGNGTASRRVCNWSIGLWSLPSGGPKWDFHPSAVKWEKSGNNVYNFQKTKLIQFKRLFFIWRLLLPSNGVGFKSERFLKYLSSAK